MSNHVLASAVQWIVWGVLMALVMGWVARSRSRARPTSQARALVQPTSILIIGIVSLVFWLAIAILSNTVGKNSTSTVGTTLAFCAFAIASLPLITAYYFGRHSISDSGMDYGGMFGSRRQFIWSEVKVVTYSQGMGWFKLELESGFVARLSAMLVGLPEFARVALAHLPREKFSSEAYILLENAREGKLPNLMGGGSSGA
ncbi:hypothetical protein [Hydrogenophaga crassostreae]|uniref:hypothetical protein n=1 Tax=Hydrogenophaga crassostreae TaxID=1763535 RepID=UPI000A57705F|nr:hypothetical protein [Hydrogenophaga crassostreae]